ncbi:hypothetical protein PMY56_13630 [Clostridium tertium]|uniref:tail completion protein gp17 n=1 Tax=Clostridium tertium TaxID=1559 RepID=UPI00232F5498|nr:hypothetical protein [Clostridium tertium]MDB1924061.1 hypothetical protein [Clostridium tertium]MDB1927178.1 hypothetical protein [Clostridium tertium]MDB1930955.1 hypothetical protein [Clostridium tertium]
MFIEEVINIELSKILNNKIFPVNAPKDIPLPYLTYQASNGENLRSIDGNYSNVFNSNFDIDLYCKTYSELKLKTELVLTTLKGMWNKTNDSIYIQAIRVGEPTELYEHEVDCYRSNIEIQIFYSKEE